MTTEDRSVPKTAHEFEEALAELSEQRDELVESARADLLDVCHAIEENDLDVDLADNHYDSVMRGVDEIIDHLQGLEEADLRELARLSAIPLDDRNHAAIDGPRALRPPPVAADPAALTFDEDDNESYRDDEMRRVLVENVDDQADHLRYLSDYAADLVRTIVAISGTGDDERAIAALQGRDAVITELRSTFTAWEVALATLDGEAPGSAGVASEMIEITHAFLRDQRHQPGP